MTTLTSKTENTELLQEGPYDVDLDKVKDAWKDRNDPAKDTNLRDVAKAADVHAIQPAGNVLDKANQILNTQRASTASIITRAKKSVLQFPIYITQGIRINEAHIISKAFERVYATLVQTVLSQNPIIDEEEANNLVFLKQFHTNLREAAENIHNRYYIPIDEFDKMMKESVFHSVQLSNNVFLEFRVVPTVNQDLIMENARLLNEPLSGFSFLTEKLKRDSEELTKDSPEHVLSNAELETVREAVNKERQKQGLPELADINALRREIDSGKVHYRFDGRVLRMRRRPVVGPNGQPTSRVIPEVYVGRASLKTVSTTEEDIRDAVKAPIFLKDSEIKKINGMLPYTLEVSFRLRLKDGSHDRDVRFIIGIKSVLHLISPSDLSEDLRELVTGNIKSLQKVRYKTGELNFKDYWFNLKGLKADAAKHINYNKRWLNTLKRLGEYDKMHGTFFKNPTKMLTGGDVPIPNGTLILSQPEVTKLTNETGIDLSVVSNAKRLAKTLFLIGIVIVDSTAGSMKVLFPDSDVDWDVQSLSSLETEVGKTDDSRLLRELNRLSSR